MKIELYHGTSKENADLILKEGFKDRVEANKRNWDGRILSQAGFVYLSRVYPFFYGSNASPDNEKEASVLKVVVDTKNLYPDEDVLRHAGIEGDIDLEDYKHHGKLSLKALGNIAVRPEHIEKILGRKDFNVFEMAMYSDPSMSPINYKIMGGYYKKLTDTWWKGGDWKGVEQMDSIIKAMKN